MACSDKMVESSRRRAARCVDVGPLAGVLIAVAVAMVSLAWVSLGPAKRATAAANAVVTSVCVRDIVADAERGVVWVAGGVGSTCSSGFAVRSFDPVTATLGSPTTLTTATTGGISVFDLGLAADGASLYVLFSDGQVERRALPALTRLAQHPAPVADSTKFVRLEPSGTDPDLVALVEGTGGLAETTFRRSGVTVGAIDGDVYAHPDGSFLAGSESLDYRHVTVNGAVIDEQPAPWVGEVGAVSDGRIYGVSGEVRDAATLEFIDHFGDEFATTFFDADRSEIYVYDSVSSEWFVRNLGTGATQRVSLPLATAPTPMVVSGHAVAFEALNLTSVQLSAATRTALPSVDPAGARVDDRSVRTVGLVATDVAQSPDQQHVFVTTSSLSTTQGARVLKIDAATGDVAAQRYLGGSLSDIDITDDGSRIFVLDGRNHLVHWLRVSDLALERTIEVEAEYSLEDIAILRDSTTAFAVAGQFDPTAIYDGDAPRPSTVAFGTHVWPGRSASEIYVGDRFEPTRVFRYQVDANGLVVGSSVERDVDGGFVDVDDFALYWKKSVDVPDEVRWRLQGASPRTTWLPEVDALVSSLRAGPKLARIVTSDPPARWVVDNGPHTSEGVPWLERLLPGSLRIANTDGGLYFTDVSPGTDGTGTYTPLTPERILDTRSGLGREGNRSPLGPAETVRVEIAGKVGVPEVGAASVVMTVTATKPSSNGHLRVFPTGIARPNTSVVNFRAGATAPNLVTVPLGADGAVNLFNAAGSTHVIFDVVGFYADDSGPVGARFVPLQQRRIADTREGTSTSNAFDEAGPVKGGETVSLRVDSIRVPELDEIGTSWEGRPQIAAVALNVTAAKATTRTFVSVYPNDVDRPTVSNLNPVPGINTATQVIVRMSEDGLIQIYNNSGEVHLIVEISGYYIRDHELAGGRFVPIEPWRYFDSRQSEIGALQPNTYIFFPGSEDDEVFSSVVLNLTAIRPTAAGNLQVTTYPELNWGSSNLNFVADLTVANHAIVRLDPGWAVGNPFGETHIAADVFGAFLIDDDDLESVTGASNTGGSLRSATGQFRDRVDVMSNSL